MKTAAQARATAKYLAKKKAEKLAAMSPEERVKYEADCARRLPGILKAHAARMAKGPEYLRQAGRSAAAIKYTPVASISQDKPNPLSNMADAAPINPPAPLLTVLPDQPVNGEHHVRNSNATVGEGTRTTWSAEERMKICVAAAAKLRAQGFRHAPSEGDRVGATFLLDAIRASQHEVLEKPRRRHIAGRFVLGAKFFRDLEIALTAKTNADVLVKKLEADQVATPAETAPAVSAALAATVMTDEEIITKGLGLASLAQLTQAAMARLFQTLGAHEAEANQLHEYNNLLVDELDGIKRQLGEVHTEMMNLHGPERKRLPMVAVLGCLPPLFQQLVSRAKANGIKCDFRHYNQDSAERAFTADYAITLRWLSRQWHHQARIAVPDSTKFKFCEHGGVGAALEQLEAWFPHE